MMIRKGVRHGRKHGAKPEGKRDFMRSWSYDFDGPYFDLDAHQVHILPVFMVYFIHIH